MYTINRNINADLIKTISIFGVVYIHAYSILGEITGLHFFEDLFRFSVPCFIILWAFFFEKSYSKKTKPEQKNYIFIRFIYLLRVFTIWSILYFLLTVEWESLTVAIFFSKHFLGNGWSGQYFFIILFQLILIYPVIRKIYTIKLLRILIIIISIILYMFFEFYFNLVPQIFQKLGYRPFYFWLPYVFLGIGLARNKIGTVSSWLILSPILIGIELFIIKKLGLDYLSYITLGTLSFSMLFCISGLKRAASKNLDKFKGQIKFIGSNTLIVFVSNPLIIIIINKIIQETNINGALILLPLWARIFVCLFSVVIVFITSLIIAKFLHKTKLIKLLG